MSCFFISQNALFFNNLLLLRISSFMIFFKQSLLQISKTLMHIKVFDDPISMPFPHQYPLGNPENEAGEL